MGCAIDHVGCDGHLECGHGAWTARHCYACINPLVGGSCTAAATTGCGVGCQKCPDFPFDMHVMRQMVWRTGKRFLRPLRGGLNRDANGRYSDLITGSPLPIPRKIDFDRAPCWENDELSVLIRCVIATLRENRSLSERIGFFSGNRKAY